MPEHARHGFIDQAPRDLASWVTCLSQEPLPVLESSTLAITELASREDDVDAHLLGRMLGDDPLFCVRLLSHAARLSRRPGFAEPETVIEALVMLGISPFFREFGQLGAVERVLQEHPWALEGFRQVLRRSYRASQFATAFAVHRMDQDAAVIREAALLHDFAELLLWVRAPALARSVAGLLQAHPTMRSAHAQAEVLHVTMGQLQHALMEAWSLPRLVVQIADDRPTGSSQALNVQLAIRLARHTAEGWDNPAIPDDVSAVAELLHLGWEPAYRLLREIDDDR